MKKKYISDSEVPTVNSELEEVSARTDATVLPDDTANGINPAEDTAANPTGDAAPDDTETPHRKRSGKTRFGVFVSGDYLYESRFSRLYPLILYCCVLVLGYIAYVFYYQRMQRLEIAQRLELQEERSRAMVYESLRMNASRHSTVTEEIKARGIDLHDSPTPPKTIKKQ